MRSTTSLLFFRVSRMGAYLFFHSASVFLEIPMLWAICSSVRPSRAQPSMRRRPSSVNHASYLLLATRSPPSLQRWAPEKTPGARAPGGYAKSEPWVDVPRSLFILVHAIILLYRGCHCQHFVDNYVDKYNILLTAGRQKYRPRLYGSGRQCARSCERQQPHPATAGRRYISG